MKLYTVLPCVGVVEPINKQIFKELFPQIEESPNKTIVTNRPYTDEGKKALKKAKWIERDGFWVPPISDYERKNPRNNKNNGKKKKSA